MEAKTGLASTSRASVPAGGPSTHQDERSRHIAALQSQNELFSHKVDRLSGQLNQQAVMLHDQTVALTDLKEEIVSLRALISEAFT